MKPPAKGGRVTWAVRHCRANAIAVDLRTVPFVSVCLHSVGDVVWTHRMELLTVMPVQIDEKVRQ